MASSGLAAFDAAVDSDGLRERGEKLYSDVQRELVDLLDAADTENQFTAWWAEAREADAMPWHLIVDQLERL